MGRLLRVQFEGAIYHVAVRGNERRLIFKNETDRQRFLEVLAESQRLHSVRLYMVCLMPNHFHLLLETPHGNLSVFMARLLTAYAVYFNRRHQRVGHLTQGRYKAQLVEGNEYLLKLSRYIHLNPVCGKAWAGVPVAERQQALRIYRWSTYRSYSGLEKKWTFIDYEPLRNLVEGQLRVDYSSYVETGLAGEDHEFVTRYSRARLALGSEGFETRVREAHEQAARGTPRREDVALRRCGKNRSIEETLATVASVLGVPEAALRLRSRNSLARGAAAWALVRHAGLTQRAAAEALGMGTGAAVSQQLTRWRQALAADRNWQTIATAFDREFGRLNF
jgi:putative transposase